MQMFQVSCSKFFFSEAAWELFHRPEYMKQVKTDCAGGERGVWEAWGLQSAYSLKQQDFGTKSCGPAKRFGESMGEAHR